MNHCSRFWICFAASMLAACASAEDSRPQTLEDDVATAVVSDRGPAGHPKVCVASALRECKLTRVDEYGRVSCPTSYQFCNEDGTDWFDCGEYDTGEDGEPVPPTKPSKPKRADEGNGTGNGNGKGNGNGNGNGKP